MAFLDRQLNGHQWIFDFVRQVPGNFLPFTYTAQKFDTRAAAIQFFQHAIKCAPQFRHFVLTRHVHADRQITCRYGPHGRSERRDFSGHGSCHHQARPHRHENEHPKKQTKSMCVRPVDIFFAMVTLDLMIRLDKRLRALHFGITSVWSGKRSDERQTIFSIGITKRFTHRERALRQWIHGFRPLLFPRHLPIGVFDTQRNDRRMLHQHRLEFFFERSGVIRLTHPLQARAKRNGVRFVTHRLFRHPRQVRVQLERAIEVHPKFRLKSDSTHARHHGPRHEQCSHERNEGRHEHRQYDATLGATHR